MYVSWRLEAMGQDQLHEIDRLLAPQRAAWRRYKDEEMRGELSPLGRVDYVHLPPGEVVVGAPGGVPLPQGPLPDGQQVRLVRSAGQLLLHATPPVPVGGTPREQAELKNDDVIAIGRARLLVGGLPQQPAVAVYDLEAPARRAYQGLRYYGDDSRYAVLGKLERHPQPRMVTVEASRGGPQQLQAVGVVHFNIGAVRCALEAYAHGPGTLFLLFKDLTNGRPGGTYAGGRFLYGRLTPEGSVLLDFNQAWNPLCAYSKYFHCPMPPRRNWLRVAIPVGEQDYGAHPSGP